MTDLSESWERTKAHLLRAEKVASVEPIGAFREYFDHNELQLAADVLAELGDERGDLSRAFWDALILAYENMGLDDNVKRCRFRAHEAQHGYVEARLTLTPTAAGGREHPIFTGYRPDWNIGNRTEAGEAELNGAAASIEDARSIPPGGTGLVRLHPTWLDAWRNLKPGAEIAMHEGSRVVGTAVVLRTKLRQP